MTKRKLSPKIALAEIIEEGRGQVPKVLTAIQKEYDDRQDVIAKPKAIKFDIVEGSEDADSTRLVPRVDGDSLELTPHSERQLWDRLQIPPVYGRKLMELGEFDLLGRSLKTMTNRLASDGLLFRKVNGVAKGILSPSYRRMDAAPIFKNFIESSIDEGFVPHQAYNTDFRHSARFLWPEVFDIMPPKKDAGAHDMIEVVVYTLGLTTGDYGGQALKLEMGVLRIWCVNLAMGFNVFRQIHLGRRFQFGKGESLVNFSKKTQDLDEATIASAISDSVSGAKDQIGALNDLVVQAAKDEPNLPSAMTVLKKRGIPKLLTDQVKALYNSDLGITELPPIKSTWRLSNAVSLVAKSQVPDLRIDMEREAARMINLN